MNKLVSGLACFIFLIITGTAVSQDLQKYYTAATTAYENKDYKTFYENIVEANKLHPYHQIILYRLGIASTHMKKQREALSTLEKAIHIDATLDLNAEDFETIRNTPEFHSLLNLQQELQKKEISSDTAFIVNDRSSHIESIATDDRNGEFYFSSIHKKKIIKRDSNGKLTDFVESGEFGLTAVFDLQVDQKNNILWACASPMPEMEGYDTTLHSALFKFNTITGALVGKYETDKTIWSVFGDLTLNNQGEVFVSDGKTNTIFIADEKTKTLQPYFTSEEFWNIQGIAFSADDQYLFIADYIKGPYRLDTSSKELVKLYTDVDLSLKGIDGLLYFNNSLIAIQNGVTPNRVTQYFLSPNHDKIIRGSVIDRAHPAFNEPTMGCISNNRLYYVANSSWGAYDKNHMLQKDKIKDLVILNALLR
ncbi:MAG: L-dopachrome tautomerase-related protein [Cyclobacteriaceae bacterium]